ncbi:MAG: YraN family protein [Candidatus Omnitrophica bacterium CG11_big_fil_rev_8_21_14_0_20_45_26]|uniref:UPF0102 protein COV74_08530 n=1 Tax=Candidatus Abzuiibacterium crystallinum TaxID=1974748 RepID=A0A2H0LMG7_9BACT|nr:MAG: YraN family protein [Candidatus Omnitrophica bacterium CG11_big_fil_rev_8_21_14_0_20_45_26]PIW63706.1 MAG: YraN family protein [Candidatus Omnitrophica bacterium CG12_big_fil_rev_8_21_14_0_65_45_16]
MKAKHLETGRKGEALAVLFLKKQGYRIKEVNYRTPLGEIDVVAVQKGIICFIEVKTRRSLIFGRPEEAVGRVKQRKLTQLAEYYMKERRLLDAPARFDVLSIILDGGGKPHFSLFQGAFEKS